MNKFEKWWYETGSGIRPLENEDKEEHAKRVCAQFYNDVVNKNNLCTLLPVVSGSAWDLPDGVYQVGVDKAAKGSKDYSCRVWMKKGINGEMIIVAEEYYR